MKKTSLEILKSPEVLIIFLLEIEEPLKLELLLVSIQLAVNQRKQIILIENAGVML